MLQLDPRDPKELAFALHKVVRQSGMPLQEIADRLRQDYGVEITPSGLSHAINRGAIRLRGPAISDPF